MRASLVAALLLTASPLAAQWQAGVGRADITPQEPVPLAGYGGKTRMSERVEHPIWIKALALRHGADEPAVIVTADLVGLSQKMLGRITTDAQKTHGLTHERLILNCSHNHSCPVTEDVLWLYYELSPAEAAVRDRYTAQVYQRYAEAIAQALSSLAPAELHYELGLAGVAVNRRRARGPESRALPGPVDHDVPVLRITQAGKATAVLFGYSCHTTALGGLSISGDYAGFTQLELERRHAGVTALFLQNCGGDANPLPRIRGQDQPATALASSYGGILAEAVSQVLAAPMTALSGPLQTRMATTKLEFKPGLPLEELRQRLPGLQGMPKREFQHFIHQYETLGALPADVPYPVQAWSFGPELTLIALTGETVVDYSLKFKAAHGWNRTWVSGYNNDLLSYVPSARVLEEGGYEGATGMFEYGHRAPYANTVEQRITSTVEQLLKGW